MWEIMLNASLGKMQTRKETANKEKTVEGVHEIRETVSSLSNKEKVGPG